MAAPHGGPAWGAPPQQPQPSLSQVPCCSGCHLALPLRMNACPDCYHDSHRAHLHPSLHRLIENGSNGTASLRWSAGGWPTFPPPAAPLGLQRINSRVPVNRASRLDLHGSLTSNHLRPRPNRGCKPSMRTSSGHRTTSLQRMRSCSSTLPCSLRALSRPFHRALPQGGQLLTSRSLYGCSTNPHLQQYLPTCSSTLRRECTASRHPA